VAALVEAGLVGLAVVRQLMAQQILVVAVVVRQVRLLVVLVGQVLSSFATQILLRRQHQLQGHPQSLWLVAIVFTNGLAQGVLHSDGTLCKTQF
jgi:hypothetical protein